MAHGIELDVTEAHSADLDAALSRFLQVARKSQSKPKVTRTYTRRSPVPPGQERPAATKTARTAHLAEIRAWALDNGYAVALVAGSQRTSWSCTRQHGIA